MFFAYPSFEILKRSVTDFVPPEVSGLDNYRWVFDTDVNLTVLKRTLVIALMVTAVCVLVAYPYAYLTTIVGRRLRVCLLGLVVVTALMSLLVRSYAWLVLLQDNGPINDALAALGFRRVEMVGHTSGVVIAMSQIVVPLMILPLYATMLGIDRRLLQAARSLGAGPFATFVKVYLPLSLPGLLAGSLLVFVLTVGFYVTPTLVGSPQNAIASQLIVTQVGTLGWGRAGALSLVLLVITLLVLTLVARAFRGSPERLVQAGATGHGEDRLRETRPVFRCVLLAIAAAVAVWMIAPAVVVAVLSLTGEESFVFPPETWSTRWYEEFFSNSIWYDALGRSVLVAVLTTALALVLGTAAAFGLVRHDFRGKTVVTCLLLAPMIVPLVIIGVGVYAVFLEWKLVGSTLGFVLAHTALAIPFVVVPVMAGLQTFDVQLEAAARNLGATALQAFRLVTLPAILPALLAGALFAFVTSFDEVVISLFIATATDRTLPVQTFAALTRQIDPTAAAASTLILAISTLAVLLAFFATKRAARG